MAYRLGIDLGTTNVVAAAAPAGGPIQLIGLGVNTTHLSAVLYAGEDGRLRVGDAAASRGAADPSRLISDPRGRIGSDLPFEIGDDEISAETATAALLTYVRDRATAQLGTAPTETVVTSPAGLTDYQLEAFDRALQLAELGPVRRCTEAEAVAAGYVARTPLPVGARIAVYDLGGGSGEATVLERSPTGFRTLGRERSTHPSGADFDEAVYRLILGGLGERGRDLKESDPDSRAVLAEIRRNATRGKEALSTVAETEVQVSLPGFSTAVRLGRPEFESLIRGGVRDSLAMLTRVLSSIGMSAEDLSAVVAVGGCCRMPIVRSMLAKEFAVPIVISDQPELDVAVGALLTLGPAPAPAPAPVAPAEPVPSVEPVIEEAPSEAITTVINPAPNRPPATPPAPAVAEDATVLSAPVDRDPPEDATVLSAAPMIWVPNPPPPPVEPPPASPPVTTDPLPEQTMPQHMIFDRFPASTYEEDDEPQTVPEPPVAVGAAPYAPRAATSPYGPNQRPPGQQPQRPPGPPPGQYPPQYPPGPQGQRPPGQRPPGPPPRRQMPPPGQRPGGPPTQPYGSGGPGGPGGYGPGNGGFDDGSGSKRRLILIIAGVVVLIGAAVGIAFALTRDGDPVANPSPTTIVQPPSGSSAPPSPTPSEPSSAPASATPSGPATPSSPTSSAGPLQQLPKAAPIPQSMVVVPMRRGGGSDRPLYLVDSEGKINRVKLPNEAGTNSNPMMQASRDTIMYLSGGVLRVMASDGSGDRELFDRDPAGCEKVLHASWSLKDPNVILLSCQQTKTKMSMLVVDLDGKLIRRLDVGKSVIGDFGLSPDGQTIVYWASDNPNLDGGSIFTLPLIGTGAPKQLTQSADGVDSDPAWSNDGTQIAFRRSVNGNYNVFVMNADGSAADAVANGPAKDFKPIWSPDDENLLIISDRKSAFGQSGNTLDLWLTRVSDGEVLQPMGLKAKAITRPFWTLR